MNIRQSPRYLRVSLLSACNLQCSYCLPPGKHQRSISAPYDKVCQAIRFLHSCGIKKIRFTGGEPTLYKDLCRLVAFIKAIDRDVHTAVTSNGVLLEAKARALSEAGLDSVNISIDTLNPTKFHDLTGRAHLNQVIAGIDAAMSYIGKVKLNCVLIRGINDYTVDKLILFAHKRGLDIRFIEFMPNHYSIPDDPRYISGKEIRNRLPWDLQPLPDRSNSAARYYVSPSLRIKVGFISPVSQPFCSGCDRIRLNAEGLLYTCLYDCCNINLFDLLGTDSNRILAEFKNLKESKRFGGYQTRTDSASILPSFSAIGG
ncbi:MAG: radical SAM protein [Phycisphaerales bacterium]|nr:MAG: radical SAM protein [Phycisphaerales bacterium]